MALTLLFTTIAYSQITFNETFVEAKQRVEKQFNTNSVDIVKYTVVKHDGFYSITVTDSSNFSLAYLFDDNTFARCDVNILGYPKSMQLDIIRYLDTTTQYNEDMHWYDNEYNYQLELDTKGDIIFLYVTERTNPPNS